MGQVVKENFRCLKRGAYAAYFINDFRKGNKFYPYHQHIMELGTTAGFDIHDMLIVDLGRGFGDVFINQYVQKRILPKRHEYGVIFRKPEKKKSTDEKGK